jgi:hypothetical protein
VNYDDHPEHDTKRHLLRLVAKLALADQRTGPASQERHQVQSALGNSTPAICGLPFIPPIRNEAGNAHHENDDQVSSGGDSDVLIMSFGSVPFNLLRSSFLVTLLDWSEPSCSSSAPNKTPQSSHFERKNGENVEGE